MAQWLSARKQIKQNLDFLEGRGRKAEKVQLKSPFTPMLSGKQIVTEILNKRETTSDSLQCYWFLIPRKWTQTPYKSGEGARQRVTEHPPPLLPFVFRWNQAKHTKHSLQGDKNSQGSNRKPDLQVGEEGWQERSLHLRKDGGFISWSLRGFPSVFPEKWPLSSPCQSGSLNHYPGSSRCTVPWWQKSTPKGHGPCITCVLTPQSLAQCLSHSRHSYYHCMSPVPISHNLYWKGWPKKKAINSCLGNSKWYNYILGKKLELKKV